MAFWTLATSKYSQKAKPLGSPVLASATSLQQKRHDQAGHLSFLVLSIFELSAPEELDRSCFAADVHQKFLRDPKRQVANCASRQGEETARNNRRSVRGAMSTSSLKAVLDGGRPLKLDIYTTLGDTRLNLCWKKACDLLDTSCCRADPATQIPTAYGSPALDSKAFAVSVTSQVDIDESPLGRATGAEQMLSLANGGARSRGDHCYHDPLCSVVLCAVRLRCLRRVDSVFTQEILRLHLGLADNLTTHSELTYGSLWVREP